MGSPLHWHDDVGHVWPFGRGKKNRRRRVVLLDAERDRFGPHAKHLGQVVGIHRDAEVMAVGFGLDRFTCPLTGPLTRLQADGIVAGIDARDRRLLIDVLVAETEVDCRGPLQRLL